jgi:hypothetical protein
MLVYPGKVQGVRLPRANLAYTAFDTAARDRINYSSVVKSLQALFTQGY